MQTRTLLLPIAALLFGASQVTARAEPVGDAPGAAGVGAAHTMPCAGKEMHGKATRRGSKGTQSGAAPSASSTPCSAPDGKSAPGMTTPGSEGTQSGPKPSDPGSAAMPEGKPTVPAPGPANAPPKP